MTVALENITRQGAALALVRPLLVSIDRVTAELEARRREGSNVLTLGARVGGRERHR